jgi:hypothetical protein
MNVVNLTTLIWGNLRRFLGLLVKKTPVSGGFAPSCLREDPAHSKYTRLVTADTPGLAKEMSFLQLGRDLEAQRTKSHTQLLSPEDVPEPRELQTRPYRLYGQIGTEDDSMFPFLYPGSLVEIDSDETEIQQSGWKSDAGRPIYFFKFGDHCACSWCELQDGTLTMIPARGSQMRYHYPEDVLILGKVINCTVTLAPTVE